MGIVLFVTIFSTQKKCPLNFRCYSMKLFVIEFYNCQPFFAKKKMLILLRMSNVILTQFRQWTFKAGFPYDAMRIPFYPLNLHNKFVLVSLNILPTHTFFDDRFFFSVFSVAVFQSHRMHACIHHYLIWLPRNVLLLSFVCLFSLWFLFCSRFSFSKCYWLLHQSVRCMFTA